MSTPIRFDLSPEEADAVLNALAYFAFAIGRDECHTLAGVEQERMQGLHVRLMTERRTADGR